MPTYEYACKTCGEHLEVVQSFKDEPLKECPACGGELRKVFSPIGITFKGSGFYKTDSRATSGPRKGRSSESESASESGSASGPGDKGDKGPGKTDKGDKAAASGSAEKSSGDNKSSSAAAS